MGSLRGGHYTAQALVKAEGQNQGKWFSFDDSRATAATEDGAKTRSAYVLFYERIE
jgi:ubiquitin C-terminal hydrolase